MSGDRVRAPHYGIVQRSAVTALRHGVALSVYVALATFANTSGECRPLEATLAEMLGVSTRHVQRGLRELQDAGLLDVKPRLRKGRKVGNEYILGSDTRVASVTPTDTTPVSPCQHDTRVASNREQTNEQTKEITNGLDPSFGEFWNRYPRHIAKTNALRAWQARVRAGIDPLLLIESAEAYAQACQRRGTTTEYMLHPATFLGPNERWLDYPPESPEMREFRRCLASEGRTRGLPDAMPVRFSTGDYVPTEAERAALRVLRAEEDAL